MKDKQHISAFNIQERAWIALGSGVLTALIFLLITQLNLQEATKRFQQRAGDVYFQTNQQFRDVDAALASLVGLHHANDSLNTTELISFTQELLDAYPQIDTVFYLPLIADSDVVEYQLSMEDSGYPGFNIHDSSMHRIPAESDKDAYLPIQFIEPLSPEIAELQGVDLLTDERLKSTLQDTFLNGGTIFSGTVELLINKPRIYGFRAVYQGYFMPETREERLNQALGVFVVEINPKHFFQNLINCSPKMGARITLGTIEDRTDNDILFSSQPAEVLDPLRSSLPTLEYTAHLSWTDQLLDLDLSSKITSKDLHPLKTASILLATIFLLGATIQMLRLKRIARIKERKAQDIIFVQRARAEATLHSIGEAVITTDIHGRIEYMNPIAERLTGWSQETANRKSLLTLFKLVDEQSGRAFPNPIERCLANSQSYSEERALMVRTDGETLAVANTTALIKDRAGEVSGIVLIIRDIRLEELTQQMTFLANHDPLTQLANRRSFEKSLKQAVENVKKEGDVHALCYIDLDHFKIINDTCGHLEGDRLLAQVTSRLKDHVRKSDLLARLGGDEFTLLLNNCPLPKATEIAELIRKDIKNLKLHCDDKVFSISTSIGIAAIDNNVISADEVLQAADNACYAAKEQGRNRIHLFHPDDKTHAIKRGEIRWIEKIQNGLHESSFALFLQSMRALDQDQKIPEIHEFLLRLPSNKNSFASPSPLIHSAERYNKMFDIDCWVIRHAFQTIHSQFKKHPEKKANNIYSINISGQSLGHPDLIPYIRNESEQWKISPANICFEITETSMVANIDQALTLMHELRSIGYSMALDNFGTGLSSFSYLKKLPFDFLKINGSSIKEISSDPVDKAMVDTINHIGQVLQMRTIAEWVEDSATLSIVRDIGVDFAQGYFIEDPRQVYPPPLGSVADKSI
ncbi:MAG: EAL domain-containing protein [Gammaproteobacteria bacterium]|nr:EAL domain-containing protein [Gammaproteobacteria bacterium]